MFRKVLVTVSSGCAAMIVGATDIVLTEDAEITVPAGETNAVEKLDGGAFTLTKKGTGVLEIHEIVNADAKVVIEEGEVSFVNTRPTDIFKKAYFHVDASDLSTLELETVNGTNFVTRWNDADGGAHFATNCVSTGWKSGPANFRTNPENRKPFISKVTQNGLPVVDFGSLMTAYNTNVLGQALGYGAALTFDQPIPEDFVEGYTVVSDTDDLTEWSKIPGIDYTKMCPMSYFCASCANFYREMFSTRGWYSPEKESVPFLYYTSRNTAVFPPTVKSGGGEYGFFENEEYKGYSENTTIDAGFHLLMALAKPVDLSRRIDSFAGSWVYNASSKNWTHEWGGQRIGEYAIYTNSLTAAERAVLNRYFRVKWMRPAMDLAGVVVKAGAKLSVDDALTVKIACYRDEQGADVELGRGAHYTSGVLRMADTALHLDASDTDSLVTTPENGTNFVTRWYDTTGNGAYAEPVMFTGYYNQRTEPEKRLPFINPTLRQNNRPVMDFGSPILATYTNAAGAAIGHGASMKFSIDYVDVAQFIAVVSDHEGFLDLPSGAINCPSYLCYCNNKTESGLIDGVRGKVPTESGTYPVLYAKNSSSVNLYNGINYFDNELVSAPKSYSPTAGFHVYDVSTVENTTVKCNRIARSARKSGTPNADAYGGYRYGEYMLFTEKLTESDRLAIFKALRTKWWGEAVVTTRHYANLKIPVSSSFEVEYENLSVTGTLAIGGTVTAPAVTVANVSALAAATVDGALTIAENAELSFEQETADAFTSLMAKSVALPAAATVKLTASDVKALKGRSVKLIAATGLTGSVGGWTATVNGKAGVVTLRVGSDGVYADFPKSGFVILFK